MTFFNTLLKGLMPSGFSVTGGKVHDWHTICVSQHGPRINIEILITMVGTASRLLRRSTGMRADEATGCRDIDDTFGRQVSMAKVSR
jgi:hypothetical protein